MGLEIANNESYVKYANKTPTRQPIGNHLNKLYDKRHYNFFKSFIKPKVDIPNVLVNSAAKTFKPDAFCKIAEGSPRPFINKINLNDLFTKATKIIKMIK